MRIAAIVEGDGEVRALPVLLRRIFERLGATIETSTPIRVKRNRFLARNRDNEFNRYLRLAATKAGHDGLVLVLLDADDDCPKQFGPELLARVRGVVPDRVISVVFANREFESWFIGAAGSLNGQRGLVVTEDDLSMDPERPRDAKGWLSARMPGRGYGETTDQASFAAVMDIDQATVRCRSFRKLLTDLQGFVANTAVHE